MDVAFLRLEYIGYLLFLWLFISSILPNNLPILQSPPLLYATFIVRLEREKPVYLEVFYFFKLILVFSLLSKCMSLNYIFTKILGILGEKQYIQTQLFVVCSVSDIFILIMLLTLSNKSLEPSEEIGKS